MNDDRKIRRELARQALIRRGYDVGPIQGRGIAPGAQLVATKNGQNLRVAVRASRTRRVGITRLRSGAWKTVDDVDLVIAVVPAADDPEAAEVFAFNKAELVKILNEALKRELGDSAPPNIDFPFYVPIDSRRDPTLALSHIAIWKERIPVSSVEEGSGDPRKNDFEEATSQYRQAAAKFAGVVPDDVTITVSFRAHDSRV